MSMDHSLKSKSTLARHRNVLTRAERIDQLKELGRWDENQPTRGLPKVAHRKASVGKKAKAEKKPGEGEVAEAAAAAPEKKDVKKDVKKDAKKDTK